MSAAKRRKRTLTTTALVALATAPLLSGCTSDAHVASQNLSVEAEQFRVERTIVFYNGITDKYIATVTGRCSVDESPDLNSTLAVTCKIAEDKYIKDYLGKSDNVTWFMLQEKPVDVSVYRYEVIFKPENVVPDFRVETGKQ